MINIFWFRRDLRLQDNAGLYHALKAGLPVLPLFIFDKNILDDLPEKKDARVEFLHLQMERLSDELNTLVSGILIKYGYPNQIWHEIAEEYNISNVFTNHDFEPYAKERDVDIEAFLKTKNIAFHTYKDHVIFEKNEVVKNDGKPYTVFTPYSKKWLQLLHTNPPAARWKGQGKHQPYFYLAPYPTEAYFGHFFQTKPFTVPSLKTIGFAPSGIDFPPDTVLQGLIKKYGETRDYPSIEGTSKLGLHFRFGTISIRKKARKALEISPVYLNELIWRDFYAQILWHFPHVEDGPFRPQYARIEWLNREADFEKWKKGVTGYPLVDAGMRQLNATGFMHNRVRMVTASFLSKHLLINWQWGEAYFAEKLLDYDLASNNGGWQWAAGCGTDAAPYFRIFNPESQLKKFDPQLKYVKEWVPEYGTEAYPAPIVEHAFARQRCLEAYRRALAK